MEIARACPATAYRADVGIPHACGRRGAGPWVCVAVEARNRHLEAAEVCVGDITLQERVWRWRWRGRRWDPSWCQVGWHFERRDLGNGMDREKGWEENR